LEPVVVRFTSDQQSLSRRYDVPDSPRQRARMRTFYTTWRQRLSDVQFDKLSQEGRADYVLLDHYLTHDLSLLEHQDTLRAEMATLVPFADSLLALEDARRDLVDVNPSVAAHTLAAAVHQADSLRALFAASSAQSGAPHVSRTVANRAADRVDEIRGVLCTWSRYYDGYDPDFTWWTKDPFTQLDRSLGSYARTLRERVVGVKPAPERAASGGARCGGGGGGADANANDGPIIGDPVGAAALKADLAYQMIPYTPDELIDIAQKQYAFSLSEMKKASRAMGFGDNWKAAVEKVKNSYVTPGRQPGLIRDLAAQADSFFALHDWVTIPPLAREDWNMEMMSPARQRVAPFFLGGSSILVAYPTDDMSQTDKMMSMRGNNPHFSHAEVFHELNPGHHLQGFMDARYNPHRRIFSTPFWSEGQSLYWEMFLWDHGFQTTPEDRVGALIWRMHRSARIIFSLKFHLGEMTPDQAVQFLVDTVSWDRANAEGEVRRSFNGSYPPLYQIGYMIGGLQLRALHHEIVDAGKMTDKEFHDAVLQGGPMPIAMVRARLEHVTLTREGAAPWRFASELPPPVPAKEGR
jgi:hypothetical protein